MAHDLLWGKQRATCSNIENVEHILLKCDSYAEERAQLKEKVCEAGREWDIMGKGSRNDQGM